MVEVSGTISIRAFSAADEQPVLALLRSALGAGPVGDRPSEFFRWKHFDNVFGPSFMLVAEADGRIVGLRAFMRWEFVAGDVRLTAVRAVDTATDPAYQGKGIFKRLTMEAIEEMRGEVDLIFNTPNEQSLPGYLKMGWRRVDNVTVWAKIRRPLRVGRLFRSTRLPGAQGSPMPPPAGEPARTAFSEMPDLAELISHADDDSRIRTPRSPAYLRWRYGKAPLLDYRVLREERSGATSGFVVFRVRPRGRLVEAMVTELLVRQDDRTTAARLLRRVGQVAQADHVTCSFAPGTTPSRARRRSGFVRVPGGITLVANPLRTGVEPDLFSLSSWSLSLGDVELF